MESLDSLLRQQTQPPSTPLATAVHLWTCTRWISEIRQVSRVAGLWPRVQIRRGRCGLHFHTDDADFGRLRWNGRLDVRLPIAMRDHLIAEEMAAPNPDPAHPEGVVWIIRSAADVSRAVWLLRLAYLSSDGTWTCPPTETAQPRLSRAPTPSEVL